MYVNVSVCALCISLSVPVSCYSGNMCHSYKLNIQNIKWVLFRRYTVCALSRCCWAVLYGSVWDFFFSAVLSRSAGFCQHPSTVTGFYQQCQVSFASLSIYSQKCWSAMLPSIWIHQLTVVCLLFQFQTCTNWVSYGVWPTTTMFLFSSVFQTIHSKRPGEPVLVAVMIKALISNIGFKSANCVSYKQTDGFGWKSAVWLWLSLVKLTERLKLMHWYAKRKQCFWW